MPVTISFPDFELPSRFPVLQVERPSWDDPSLGELATRFEISGKFEDRGLWHVIRDERSALEIYVASHSFRLTRSDGGANEWEFAAEAGLAEAVAIELAGRFAEPFLPSAAASVKSVVESEVLLSTSPDEEPKRLVTGTQVNYAFAVEGVPLIGPGAKMQVAIRPAGEILSSYRMWRNVTTIDEVPGFTVDEIAGRFGRGPMFARFGDEAAAWRSTWSRPGCCPFLRRSVRPSSTQPSWSRARSPPRRRRESASAPTSARPTPVD